MNATGWRACGSALALALAVSWAVLVVGMVRAEAVGSGLSSKPGPGASSLSGVVRSPQGPVEGVNVTVMPASGGGFGQSGYTFTAADGSWRVGNLPADTYIVDFLDSRGRFVRMWSGGADDWSKATKYALAEGASRSGVDVTLQPGGHLSGVVSGLATIEPYTAAAAVHREVAGGFSVDHYGSSFWLDADGSFDVGSLPAGRYKLAVQVNGLTRFYGGDSLETAQVFTVGAGQTVGGLSMAWPQQVTLTLVSPPTVTGKARVGQTLTVTPGVWSPAEVNVEVGWTIGNTSVSNQPAVRLKKSWRGKRIYATVWVSRADAAPVSKRTRALVIR